MPMHQTVDIQRPTPPDTYPPIHVAHPGIDPLATGVAGLVGGGLVGAGLMTARKLGQLPPHSEHDSHKPPGPGPGGGAGPRGGA